MTLNSFGRIARALALLTLASGPSAASAIAQTTGPHALVHRLDLGGSGQSLIVRLSFDGPLSVTLESARLVSGRAHGRSGEPPLLRIRLRNAAGIVMDQFNAWHPLWAFEWDGERDRKRLLPKARGRFVLPYTPNAPPARIEFTDVRASGPHRHRARRSGGERAVTPLLPGIVLGKSFW